MSAIISPCGLYRYRLERDVGMDGPVYAFFGINPSTADAREDDATVRKWTGFVKAWGGSRFVVGNVWPLRATDVRLLARSTRWLDIYRENQRHILAMAVEADILVPCWGDRAKVPRSMHNEIDELLSLLLGTRKPVMHFGLTKSGDPKHPLMLAYSTPLTPWTPAGAAQ
ncbi:DUF1643 domain-containing protein [Pigmentiphaga kullae]|uniref:DUF1643 domain-containing protein n=1 Tax=Pigmentiphaga kullae TaxID=151784 RepID=A0A4Q7NC62_9BURK|nr:DUF1643 domain-containing protein [Pigmentiphaga kullae]RZS80608.1 hypothetical protein EV675_3220 [Pigmentiphaga kullae]